MKKIVSLLLALVFVLALGAVPAVAADDYVKLTWVMGMDADAPKDYAMVAEELNKISREKLGVEMDMVYMKNEQCLTSIQAGEVYDMYFTCDWYNDYVTQAYAGIFADLTTALPEITPALYATMPEVVWEGAKVDGKIYAIPVKKDYCPEIFLMFDKELFKEKGMEIPAEMKFEDLTPYLVAYKEANPEKYPWNFAKYPSGFDGHFNFINRTALIGFPYEPSNPENATKIISVFEDEEMIVRLTAMHEWYKAGYIAPDVATTESVDNKEHHFKIGQGFYGADAIWSSGYQYPVQISRISGPYLSASGVRGSMNALSATLANDPERMALALKYQELVNTDAKYRDILRYGVEGVHFNYNANGTVTKTPVGIDNYAVWAFAQGSYALSAVEDPGFAEVPVDPKMWEYTFKMYETDAIVAADFGFSYDPTACEMEIAQINVIKEKYINALYSGTADPAVELPKVIAEMEAAGLRDVIKDAQTQLDAFLAAKK